MLWPLLGWPLSALVSAEESSTYGASASVVRESFERGRSQSVVGRERIEATGADNVGDILERVPALTVQRTASGSATPILRGLTGNQVLLMVDDLRLNDALTRAGGSASLNLIDPESVERLEVVRGPASVLYGSDALGGVVHVRTFDAPGATEPSYGGTAAARAASAETALAGSGAVTVALDQWGARLGGRRAAAGTVQRGGALGPQPYTGHDDWSASGKIQVEMARGQRLSLSHQSGHLLRMPRPDVSSAGDEQRTDYLERDASVLTYHGQLFERRVRLHAYLGLVLRREQRRRLRPANEQREREHVTSYQAGLRATTSAWARARLELGLETVLDRVASRGSKVDGQGTTTRERGRYVHGSRYDMHAAYVLLTQGLSDRLVLLLGARGTLVTARAPEDPLFVEGLEGRAALDRQFARPVASVGVRAELTPVLHWVVSLHSGFRAPNLEDFQAFGGGARGYTVPNLSLREERSWTLETGVEQSDGPWTVQAFAFASLLSGLIVRAPATLRGISEVQGEPVISRRNVSRTQLVGGEVSLTYTSSLGLFASVAGAATWGKSERPDDQGTQVSEPAAKVPPASGALRVGYARIEVPYFGELALSGQAPQRRLSQGDLSDVRICPEGPEGCSRVAGFTDLTVRAGLRLDRRVTIAVAAENLLDAAYRTYASGTYAPGRNFSAVLRARW